MLKVVQKSTLKKKKIFIGIIFLKMSTDDVNFTVLTFKSGSGLTMSTDEWTDTHSGPRKYTHSGYMLLDQSD